MPAKSTFQKGILLTTTTLFVAGFSFFIFQKVRYNDTRNAIELRYEALRQAFASPDPEAYRAFVAPEESIEEIRKNKKHFNQNFEWIQNFGTAGPVDEDWDVTISGSKATVIPNRMYHYKIIPGGSGFEMIKVDGEWFITGRVLID